MAYRYEATSVAGFIQQLAVGYLCRGYYFYVVGEIPEGKDPAKTDAKIIERYAIAKSKFTRSRERRKGVAGMQYLRYRRYFVIIATKGNHQFFREEAKSIRDVREAPIQFEGHSIGFVENHGKGHPSVRIAREQFAHLKEHYSRIAVHQSAQSLLSDLEKLPYQRFAPVRSQILLLLRIVNRAREKAGLSRIVVPQERLKRYSTHVFRQGSVPQNDHNNRINS
jgi:hypothetical protein